ncbi:hypothetical protein EI94DRAFT_1757143 [Lactarius quietus]|nr:hypothetical protein EI94DRAFT_1757143 [Lactarius quietus]
MVAGLAHLTRLKTLSIVLSSTISLPDQRRRYPEYPMQVVLPVLSDFEFRACNEYLEDLVAQLDAPRLNSFRTALGRLDSLRVPQLTLFIGRADSNPRFRRAQVEFSCHEVKIKSLVVDQPRPESPDLDDSDHRPPFSLSTSHEWLDTHAADMAYVLSQIRTMFSAVDYVYICPSDHPGWDDDIDNTEWLAFFYLLNNVETFRR